PRQGLPEPGLEALAGLPAELATHHGDVHGVAAIVAGTVGNESDQLGIGTALSRPRPDEQRAQRLYHLVVCAFALAADVVGLARLTLCQHDPQRLAVVRHI